MFVLSLVLCNRQGHAVSASSKEDCCNSCLEDSDCVAAVFVEDDEEGGADSCWLKNGKDIAGGSVVKANRMGCKKVPAPPGPPKYSLTGKVPGDLITDLQNAGMIGDPLYELNFKNASLWDTNVWTYTTTVTMDASRLAAALAAGSAHVLVFDGVKMGASVTLNGKSVGIIKDQFLRWVGSTTYTSRWPLIFEGVAVLGGVHG